jgi:hypothetical protein
MTKFTNGNETYTFTQVEADKVIMNKSDEMTAKEADAYISYLKHHGFTKED